MRRAAKVDSNHGQIAEFFRAHGCEVESLARLGNGVPDLLVRFGYGGRRLALVELKSKGGTLTPKQRQFAVRFPFWVVTTTSGAQEVINWLKCER